MWKNILRQSVFWDNYIRDVPEDQEIPEFLLRGEAKVCHVWEVIDREWTKLVKEVAAINKIMALLEDYFPDAIEVYFCLFVVFPTHNFSEASSQRQLFI